MALTIRLAASLLALALLAAGPGHAQNAGKQPPPLKAGSVDAGGVYQLSAEEQGMDCKKLSGRVQVRLLQMRNMQGAAAPSGLAQDVKQAGSAAAGVLLGKSSTFETDAGKRASGDRAMLAAYNKQLAAKGCKTYDIDAELNGKQGSGAGLPAAKPATPPAAKPAAK
jgi:Tfp pilus assembly protein PilX